MAQAINRVTRFVVGCVMKSFAKPEMMIAALERSFTPEPNSGCWLWTGWCNAKGYGTMTFDGPNGRQTGSSAHRVAYRVWKGEIPAGHVVDHLCRVRCCINPDHLEAVTPAENWWRGQAPSAIKARLTNCANGHPLSGENLTVLKNGGRLCKACNREYYRAYRVKNRGYLSAYRNARYAARREDAQRAAHIRIHDGDTSETAQ